MSTRSKLVDKLKNPEYRARYVGSRINFGLPFQIRSLMKQRGWTQEDLARRAGMLQPRISAMLKPGKSKPNIETLRRLAEAFDVGLEVRFAPFSDLIYWSDRFDPDSFSIPSFNEDSGLIETTEVGSGTATLEVAAQARRISGLRRQHGYPSHQLRIPASSSRLLPQKFETETLAIL